MLNFQCVYFLSYCVYNNSKIILDIDTKFWKMVYTVSLQ